QGNCGPPAVVAMPVRHQIVGDAVEPGRECVSPIFVALDVLQRAHENAGRQVLRIGSVAGAVVDIAVDLAGVALIQLAKRLSIFFGLRNQRRLFSAAIHAYLCRPRAPDPPGGSGERQGRPRLESSITKGVRAASALTALWRWAILSCLWSRSRTCGCAWTALAAPACF